MRLVPLAAFILWAGGCASTGLKYTIEDATIAKVPLLERQEVLAAQDDVNQARSDEQESAQRLQQIESEEKAAEQQRDRAAQQVEQAEQAQKAAGRTRDITKVNAANRQRGIAAAQGRAADAQLEFLGKRKAAVQASQHAAERHVQASLARCELEKAKLVQAKQLPHQGSFDVARFEEQWKAADAQYQEAKNQADLRAADAKDGEAHWRKALEDVQQMKGSAQPAEGGPAPAGGP